MQARLLLLSYLFLSNFLLPDSQSFLTVEIQEADKQYVYIYAPSGLNMREGPTTSYQKLTKIPYGAKVEVLVPAKKKEITIDGLIGGMAKVSYEGYIGYAFDGYMSQFQAPSKNMKVMEYVEALRQDRHMVYYEKVERDYDGYFQFEESIIVHKSNWREAFLLAKQLFAIPPKLNFPPKSSKTESKYINPDKRDLSWSDELTVTRDQGHIAKIDYYYRAEGGGIGVSIAYFEQDSDGIKITKLEMAD